MGTDWREWIQTGLEQEKDADGKWSVRVPKTAEDLVQFNGATAPPSNEPPESAVPFREQYSMPRIPEDGGDASH